MTPNCGDTRSGARVLLVGLLLLIATATSACFVEPIDQGRPSVAPSEHLRDGPQTATLPDADVNPVADDPTPRLPTTVDSLRYGRVTVTDASRVIAVDQYGTLGTIVFSLGLGSHVVGRDASTSFGSAAHLPVVTNRGHSINAEAVLALAPTLLLVTDTTLPQASVDQIRNSGVTVVVFSGRRSLAGDDPLMRAVASTLGVAPQGEQLIARAHRQIEQARRRVPSPSGDPSMMFIYVRGPGILYVGGPGSGADDLIAELGGVDAAQRSGLSEPFTKLSAEAVLAADPDVILVMTQGAATVGGPDGVLALPGIADTGAGRHRRVVQMDQSTLLSFGPDTGEVIAALAEAIYT
ncbi:ABC transporter substrate-binding protein [Gordonia sp. ABSL1-1]|uniref:heme/hemin ABC transporter substrate-binding protein n=1 Tax=Gordonia sp. ABSL1-1 TaxID=3053923 RepID=UPI0025744594|nr:ABC transporter substrate-binding protein [Gordonia sp. ABSL1-1]MDL9936273.1 ABC transporter substrate-binding protein [Gordonia sp. ABSL1-1]